MEKKTSKLNRIITILFLLVLTLLLISTIYKLNKNHEKKLYDVLYSEIEYYAKECFLKKECDSEITLKELYEKKYLSIKYDPITKEELNEYIKIIISDEKIEIVK